MRMDSGGICSHSSSSKEICQLALGSLGLDVLCEPSQFLGGGRVTPLETV